MAEPDSRRAAVVGLEVRVGPLIGFFGPAVVAAAVAAGEPPPSEHELRARIEDWRRWVGDGLVGNGHLASAPDWDEDDPRAPQRSLLPLDALRALKLRIAYGERRPLPPLLPARPELDPRWVELAEAEFADTPYDQVVVPEFWLPGDFAFTFPCPWPDGHVVRTGSVTALRRQLAALRETLLGGTPFDGALWATSAPGGDELVPLARLAAAALERASQEAEARHQPMLIAARGD